MQDTAVAERIQAVEPEQIFTMAMDIGDSMLTVGAEVNRVEDTVTRICSAYGIRAEVFSVTSLIIATARTADGHTMTQTRRNSARSTDFRRLEDYNALSRYICENLPDMDEIRVRKAKVDARRSHKLLFVIPGYIMGAGGFAMFFGGGFVDFLAAAFIALVIMVMDRYLKPLEANVLVYTVLCSVIAGSLAIGVMKLGVPIMLDKVMIGDIMILIPGMAITNSIRDMFCGDIMTGLLRFAESLLLSAAIAAGFAIPMIVFGVGV